MSIELAKQIAGLFRGRQDVTAVATGPASFAPERVAVTPERIAADHLSGRKCLGFYLLSDDATVLCSCADFDNHADSPDPEWRTKAETMAFMLDGLGLSPIVETSQSGSGAHVWMFFRKPVEAWRVRAFWRACADKLNISVKEIYPRQDKLEAGGIGNLVRFPLWNKSRIVDVNDEWAETNAGDALRMVSLIDPDDLDLVAFQAGLGELKRPASIGQTIVAVEGGESLPVRVARLLENGSSLLAKRWNNETTGMADRSRSAVAMSLCTELVRLYVPTPEIEATLRAWLRRFDPEGKYNRASWISGTVLKAYDFVVNKREVRSMSATTTRDAAHAYIDQIEKGGMIHVPSGIRELDDSIDGVAPGEMCVVAGRPNHGKSAVGFQWVAHAAEMGVSSLIISEEMSAIQIGKRRVLSISNVPGEHHVPSSVPRLRRDVDEYHKGKADVFIVESAGTISRVESLIDQYCTLYNVGLVMVDYMQLLRGDGKDRYEGVTNVSQRLKASAARNGTALIALSQLNRAVESRDDHEPKMSDLRESGGIEQDADLIIFCQYPKRMSSSFADDEYRLYCAKRRNGPIREGRVLTTFDPSKQRIGGEQLPASALDL